MVLLIDIPAQAASKAFDIYKIEAVKPATVFESTVAGTITDAGVRQTGKAMQTIVPNRASFSSPVKIGQVKVK